MLSSDKSNIFVSIKVHLASVYEKMLSSVGVTFSLGLISKSIVCCVCVMFSSDVSWGMNDEEKINNNLNKENDEIEIKVEKVQESSAGQIKKKYSVVLLGNGQVGKTQILNKEAKDKFYEFTLPTIGVDFGSTCYKYTIKNNKNQQFIKLQIWDTGEQERFKKITIAYLKNADVVVLVYDITNKTSFDDLNDWLKLAKEKATKEPLLFLVGNKADMGNDARKVSTEEAQNFAKENNMTFLEVSAKNGNNIKELFEEIARACAEKHIEYHKDEYPTKNEDINMPQHGENKRCSCCPCNKDKKE